jgi:Fe-S-cluster-containing dehydrogenase component/anaerobic selenocysteine-containing dehydrogenase
LAAKIAPNAITKKENLSLIPFQNIMEKKYWQSLEMYKEMKKKNISEKEAMPEFSIEGLDESELKGKSSRRDFLKMMGFSVGAVALVSSCQMPVRKAIPLLNRPQELTPGVPNYYASTFYDGDEYCSILVKTRESRPIKIEGNDLSPISKRGTTARVQASVLDLYDDARLKGPLKNGKQTSWKSVDKEITAALDKLKAENKQVVLMTDTIISPTTRKLIGDFMAAYPNVKWIQYDSLPMSAMRQANQSNFGKAVIPFYHFENAEVIAGFNADFLGTWLMPVTFSKQFAKGRKIKDGQTKMSRFYQFETNMSLTGSNADYRYQIKPSEEAAVLLKLYNVLAKKTGHTVFGAPAVKTDVNGVAKDLLKAKGKSLVVSGTNNLQIQLIVNAINNLLGNYGKTIDLNTPVNLKQGSEQEMMETMKAIQSGKAGGALFYDVNPAYDCAHSDNLKKVLKKLSLKVSFARTLDETAALCDYVCPDNNYLESWNDVEPVQQSYSFTQPTIRPIFDTRQFQDSLLTWMKAGVAYSDYLENNWKENFFPKQKKFSSFDKFWFKCKQDGVYTFVSEKTAQPSFKAARLKAAKPGTKGLELALYEKISMGTGKHANNPWLQEMPDPVSTATWDNYVTVSPAYAEAHGLKQEDVVKIDGKIELPVLIQPGQTEGTIGIAVGYGRSVVGKVGKGVGKNVFGLMNTAAGTKNLLGKTVTLSKTSKTYPLALTQTHHVMEGRPIVRETVLGEFIKNPAAGNEEHEKFLKSEDFSLYPEPKFNAFQWGLSIDLNSCTGCSNCLISCQAENNVAVVGKEQVRLGRIMHWIRVDRYYSEMADDPEVFHMPVMCQQCDNAPCENVCPVAATTHSDEGLNQMAYNRCIGTRYCMNNCPYKVRRFNWYEYVNNNSFDFNMNSELGKLVLNPDVTVRQRGVVEKCTFCVQRIQEKKLEAKAENRELRDGEILTACQQSCPTDAIQFGNLLDKKSKVSQSNDTGRMYHLLESLHTLPSLSYLTKVRNKEA